MRFTLATLLVVAAGLIVTRAAVPELARRAAVRRRNYRGLEVAATGGIALVLGLLAAGAVARLFATPLTLGGEALLRAPIDLGAIALVEGVALVALAFALLGFFEDLSGGTDAAGWRVRAQALRSRRATAEAITLGGGIVAGLVFSPGATVPHLLICAAIIVLSARLIPSLDQRPLRAAKAGAAWLILLLVAALIGADPQPVPGILLVGATIAALWRAEATERVALGTAGTSALGAALGLLTAFPLADDADELGRLGVLALLIVLTLVGARPGFPAVIERIPLLRRADRWGRQAEVDDADLLHEPDA